MKTTQVRPLASALMLALATSLAVPASAHTDKAKSVAADHHSRGTIVEVAAGNADFSTLVAAVQAADLVGTLSSPGPFTVFAPTNAAFDALPDGTVESLLQPAQRDALVGVLTYHVVAGRLSAADVVAAVRAGGGHTRVTTVEGSTLTIRDAGGGRLTVRDESGNTFNIVATDVGASNGVIHVIDGVLLPR